MNRIANIAGGGPTLLVIEARLPVFLQPVVHERLNVGWQFVPVVGATAFGELSKPHKYRNADKHIPGGVVLVQLAM